ncbi:MAG: uroporphyrinogen-III C-methyltransferase [Hyphomicrobiales bacterium]|nr:uroporphyrinogen-III C-methyltransferase [Hyphomicrobiales bacterium]MBV8825799.1 uroporphyrinogen-III C-methyltransferase [Hyphomicrobiales bacterium]MBV9428269.1 uroporphyrinogen-III C-methyltransferase [Bradyrhizobiaceae bacterium]
MSLSLIPAEPQPARIAPLARLPVFLKLEGRRAIVAGASAAAAWKAELLAAAGATVDVYAPEPSAELLAIAGATRGIVAFHARPWTAADFADAAIAIGACDNDAEAARFSAASRAAGVPVNVIDRPAYCDFAFGAIVNRSPLVIGISTDGAAPVFAQAIRARIETLLPHGFARWAEAAAHWRPRVQALGRAVAARFWESFAARAVTRAHEAPDEGDFQALLAESNGDRAAATAILIVAPDDPELLTLRAVRALQSADVILFDGEVAPAILDFARREARRMLIAARGGDTYGESAATLIALAKAGRHVVRLTGPGVARAEAEIAACRTAGVTVEIVPTVVSPPPSAVMESGKSMLSSRHER